MMASDNDRKVSEEFVIKVFDRVKEANEGVAEDIKGINKALVVLAELFKRRFQHQPAASEIRDEFRGTLAGIRERLIKCETRSESIHILLKEHCDHAEKGICSIEEELKEEEGAFLAIQEKVDPIPEIKKIVDTLKNRVNLMIGVVAVAFTIFVLAYFFVSSSVDKVVEDKMHSIEQHYQHDLKEDISDLKEIIKKHVEWDEQGQ